MFKMADIDECTGFTGCHQKCNNTDGGYECDCLPGYALADDETTCEGIPQHLIDDSMVTDNVKSMP